MFRHVLIVAAAVLVAAPSAASAASCKKHKEEKGCALPSGTSYQYSNSDTDEMNLTVDRGKAQLKLGSACVQQRFRQLPVKSKLKVGRSYRFNDTLTKTSELQDGITVTYTYKLDLTIKISSARKATATGTAVVTAPAVPPQGSFQGEDAYNANCKLNKTLKRVVAP